MRENHWLSVVCTAGSAGFVALGVFTLFFNGVTTALQEERNSILHGFNDDVAAGATANATRRLADRQPPPVGFWSCVICAVLCQILYAVGRAREAILAVRETIAARGLAGPTLIAPSPVLSPQAEKFLHPPPVQGKQGFVAKMPFIVSLGAVVLAGVGIPVVLIGSVVGRQNAEKSPIVLSLAGEHDARLKKLAEKMHFEGYVWRTEAGDQLCNLPPAWEGKGPILNATRPEWEWRLTREGIAGERPGFSLHGEISSPQYWRLVHDEWHRWDDLPAGSSDLLLRLGAYAEAMYEEDHQGRAEEPRDPQGTIHVLTRRKKGPQDYSVIVYDTFRSHTGWLSLEEVSQPAHMLKATYVVAFDP